MFATRNLQRHCLKTLASAFQFNPSRNNAVGLMESVPSKLVSTNVRQSSVSCEDGKPSVNGWFRTMSTARGRTMRSKVEEALMHKDSGTTLNEIRRTLIEIRRAKKSEASESENLFSEDSNNVSDPDIDDSYSRKPSDRFKPDTGKRGNQVNMGRVNEDRDFDRSGKMKGEKSETSESENLFSEDSNNVSDPDIDDSYSRKPSDRFKQDTGKRGNPVNMGRVNEDRGFDRSRKMKGETSEDSESENPLSKALKEYYARRAKKSEASESENLFSEDSNNVSSRKPSDRFKQDTGKRGNSVNMGRVNEDRGFETSGKMKGKKSETSESENLFREDSDNVSDPEIDDSYSRKPSERFKSDPEIDDAENAMWESADDEDGDDLPVRRRSKGRPVKKGRFKYYSRSDDDLNRALYSDDDERPIRDPYSGWNYLR